MGFLDFLFPGEKSAQKPHHIPLSPESLARMLGEGRKIEAIKMIRAHSGAGLKDLVEYLESETAR